jgi:very-short-patch-repair endonuclease
LPEQKDSDEWRTEWLQKHGYKVIRFTNEEVLGDIKRVLETIKRSI